MEEENGSQGVQINANDDLSRGRYSNSMLISHGPEEFIIDWLLQSPNGVHLVSRIVVSPGHLRRIVSALQENLVKYEEGFGELEGPTTPQVVH
jgi:hypothetical protein